VAKGARSGSNTEEILGEIMQLLTEAKLAPDAQANMQFIDALMQGIVKYIQAMRQRQIQGAIQGGQPGGPGQGPGGLPGQMAGAGAMGGMGGMGGAPQQIGAGGGPGMSGFGASNQMLQDPDALRRTLAGPAAVGRAG
jgi:hypothetical protein